MQVASLQAATSNLQVTTEHITTARNAATRAELGVVSYPLIKQIKQIYVLVFTGCGLSTV